MCQALSKAFIHIISLNSPNSSENISVRFYGWELRLTKVYTVCKRWGWGAKPGFYPSHNTVNFVEMLWDRVNQGTRVCLHPGPGGKQLACRGRDLSCSVSSCGWKSVTGHSLWGPVGNEYECPCQLLTTFFPVWVTVHAISVETPKDVLRAARGKSVTLPCTYQSSSLDREGFIQWDKLLRSHTVRIFKKLGASWVPPDHDPLEDKHYKAIQ